MPRKAVPARTPANHLKSKLPNKVQRKGKTTNGVGTLSTLPKGGTATAAPLTVPDILALQNTAGNKAVRRMLGNRPAVTNDPKISSIQEKRNNYTTTPVIQRTPLKSDDIIASLDRIDFIKKKLAMKLHGVHTNDPNDQKKADLAKRAGKEKSMRERVEATLAAYQDAFAAGKSDKTANAMMMAIAIQGVARVVAEEIYEPGLTPKLAKRLLELYRSDIKAAMGTQVSETIGKRGQILDLAESFVADDPLALFMHRELRPEHAAKRIKNMADAAGEKPKAMFKLLKEKFEAEMLSQTRKEISDSQEDKGLAYGTREATGEISHQYFQSLFGDVDRAQFKDTGDKTKGLSYTTEAQAKLDQLSKALDDHLAGLSPADLKTGEVRSGVKLTAKQTQHLKEIEAAEEKADLGSIEAKLVREFVKTYEMARDTAENLVDRIKKGLPQIPLSITGSAKGWFGNSIPLPGKAQFRPATRQVTEFDEKDVLGKGDQKIKGTGAFDNPDYAEERGAQYLQFRNWKDNLMTSLLDFSSEEMPTFGAVNAGWETAHGSAMEDYGENYYGDMHFLMKKDRIADRTVYTATDHGQPRRNIFLAFADFVLGGSHTGLKDVQRLKNIVPLIINAITTKKPLAADLQFEIQIFGTVDISQDVEKIFVAKSVTDDVRQNIATFHAKGGPPLEVIGDAPTGLAAASDTMVKGQSQSEGDVGQRVAKQGKDITKDYIYRSAHKFVTYAGGLDLQDKGGRDSIAAAFKEIAGFMDGSNPKQLSYDQVTLYRTIYDQYKKLVQITGDPDLKAALDQHKKPSYFYALKARYTK